MSIPINTIVLIFSCLVLSTCHLFLDVEEKNRFISVENPWVRVMPPSSTSSAAYMKIYNHSDQDIHLRKVAAEPYGNTMLHQSINKKGMVSMHHRDQVTIPSKQEVELAPGGLHVMLLNKDEARILQEGDRVRLRLQFEGGLEKEIEAVVRFDDF